MISPSLIIISSLWELFLSGGGGVGGGGGGGNVRLKFVSKFFKFLLLFLCRQ